MSKRQEYIIVSGYSKDDPFGFKAEAEKHVTFYCKDATDLRKTLRCITPRGYRIRTVAWVRNRMKGEKEVILRNILGNTMHTIKPIDNKPEIMKTLDFTNSFGFTHTLKFIKNEN